MRIPREDVADTTGKKSASRATNVDFESGNDSPNIAPSGPHGAAGRVDYSIYSGETDG